MSSNTKSLGLTEADKQRCREYLLNENGPNSLLPQDPSDRATEDLSFNSNHRNVTPAECVLVRRLSSDPENDQTAADLAEKAGVEKETIVKHIRGSCSHDVSEPATKS